MHTSLIIDFKVSLEYPDIIWESPHFPHCIFATPHCNGSTKTPVQLCDGITDMKIELPYFKDPNFWANFPKEEHVLFQTPQFRSYYNYMTETGLRKILSSYNKHINKHNI